MKYLFAILTTFNWITNVNSQVYNYVPIEFQNMESNPAVMGCKFYKSRANISYIWSAQPIKTFNNFSFSYSKQINKKNAYGLSIENTNQDIDELYRIIAIGGARNHKLNNRWSLHGGLLYKFVKLGFQNCNFDYFEYTANNYESNFINIINASAIVTDTAGNYYFSLSYLNLVVPIFMNSNKIEFPSYLIINIGNFGNLLVPSGKLDLNYSSFVKSTNQGNTLSQYINIGFGLKIGKHSGLKVGLRTGLCESYYYHLNPYICYSYKNLINLKFAFNYHAELESGKTTKIPTYQTSNTSIFP